MSNPVQVFEYGKLLVGEELTRTEFDRLAMYNERHGSKFFDVGHRRLRFKNYVGVIQVGGKTIEILPKVDGVRETDTGRWHNVLVEMLRRCGYLNLEALTESRLHLERGSLFDLYLESFLAEVAGIAHQGLAKKYNHRTGNLGALKGQLKFAENIRRNLVHRERFFTRHQSYDRNNAYNQILKQALAILANGQWRSGIATEAKHLLLSFEGVEDVCFDEATFARLRFDRETERYRRAIALARLIILNYSPDVKGGGNNLLAILFDMNALFERYVYCELRKSVRDNPAVAVTCQTSQWFWESTRGLRKRIRPDIVIETEGMRVILDTKWKLPWDGRPADADLKQMYAYNLQFGADRSYLVYPGTGNENTVWGNFVLPAGCASDSGHGCGMIYIQLLDDNHDLDMDMGSLLMRDVCAEK